MCIRDRVGGFYLKPTDVKLSFYQAKDGTVVPKLQMCIRDRFQKRYSPASRQASFFTNSFWIAIANDRLLSSTTLSAEMGDVYKRQAFDMNDFL